MIKISTQSLYPLWSIIRPNISDSNWQQQQCAGKNRRNNTCRVNFQRQVRTFSRSHTQPNLTLWILNQNSSLSHFHFQNNEHQSNAHNKQAQNNQWRHRTDTSQFQSLSNSGRNISNNTNGNNQGRTITNTTRSNLFTQPYNKHCTTGQRYDC